MLIKNKRLSKILSARHTTLSTPSEISRVAQLELHKAKQEAKAIKEEAENVLNESKKKLKEAEEKARDIINSTNIQAKEIKEKVYKETLQLATNEAEQIKQEAKQLLSELFQVKREALTQAHTEIIKVAMDLAEKILKYKASIDPNILKTQVVEAIKRVTSEADRVQVFVNPADLNFLKEHIPEIEKLFPSGIQIIPLPHESVDPRSCIVETKSGQLDASFSTQLKTLASLVSHIEVPASNIQLEDEVLSEEQVQEPPQVLEEELLNEEEKILKEELLDEEPLIDIPEVEEAFPFQEEQLSTESQTQATEDTNIAQIPKEIIEPKKKRVFSDDLLERTKEEKEELDREEGFDFDEEEEPKEKEELNVKSILKPKKKAPGSEVSKIASEIEENPEWKNLIEDEE